MEDLIFSLNATIPLFLTMVLGLLFRKMRLFNDSFLEGMNSFVFKVALPAALFNDLAGEDFFEIWDFKFALCCNNYLYNSVGSFSEMHETGR